VAADAAAGEATQAVTSTTTNSAILSRSRILNIVCRARYRRRDAETVR